MPYDSNQNQIKGGGPNQSSFGTTGRAVTPSDTVDLAPYAKSLVVLAAGTLKILPMQNGDASPIAYTDPLPANTVIPFMVRRVFATGTTATVATIDG
jgi:hypothetical protein